MFIKLKNQFVVIILAAGKGTRMKSNLPKVLHNIGGQPMIMHVVNKAKRLGAQKIITVIGYQAEKIKKSLINEKIEFAYQLEQKGTGHAVLQCHDLLKDFKGNVLILSGDVPLISCETLKKLLLNHEKNNVDASILTTEISSPTGYGRIIRNNNSLLKEIVEEVDASDKQRLIKEINSGIYAFKSNFLFNVLPLVKNKNTQNEYYLPDVFQHIINKNGKVAIEKTKNYSEIQGVNNIEELSILNLNYEKN
tara:strand:- start:12124 stop:12873 length:750 start_codon:yes stop_codon:yes gene_type:complete